MTSKSFFVFAVTPQSQIDFLQCLLPFCCIMMREKSVKIARLRFRITLMWNRILILIIVMGICDHWSVDHPWFYFKPLKLLNFDVRTCIQLCTQMRIQIKLPKIIRIRICNRNLANHTGTYVIGGFKCVFRVSFFFIASSGPLNSVSKYVFSIKKYGFSYLNLISKQVKICFPKRKAE